MLTARRTLLVVAAALVAVGRVALLAQPAITGQWQTLSTTMPINPVHAALLNNGKVLIVSGSGNLPTDTFYQAAIFDPQTGIVTTQPVGWDMFCNGMVVLSDGRAFVNGGTLQYDPFHGETRSAAYDPATGAFTDVQRMAHGRWYPTVTTLGDGSVMTFSGLNETGGTNTAVEIYRPGTGWSAEFPAGWTPPLYPRMHLLPNGNVFYSGSGTGSRIFSTSTHTWSGVIATTNSTVTRTYGTSVLLPLTPANGYKPTIIIMGGGGNNPSTETIDLSAATPAWQKGPDMSQGRIEMNATILPNGRILATGGSTTDEDPTTASLNADLYDPATNTFSSAGANRFARLYHSNALLLPDATVLLLGGNPQRGTYEPALEVYSPAYLFDASGNPAVRPTIADVTAGPLNYGAAFQVQTPDASDIASVVLMRPGAPTHAFDMEQRLVGLSFTTGTGVLNVTAPPNGNIAPPGYYMLFLVNSAGVPSIARFVQVMTSTNQAPTATITSPPSAVTIDPGASVSFAGTGTDPDGTIAGYAWSFPGGSPAASSVATPGAVVYANPGTYTASFTVTDNLGLSSPAVTQSVTVRDFSVSASPASQAVMPGGATSYSVTAASSGFGGTIGFSVTGLPSGATASFSPPSVVGAGSSTLSVSTSTITPIGTYTLTIAGTNGSLTHTTTVSLVVRGDFSISALPASATVRTGSSATFTVTISSANGFAGTVSLSTSGLPNRTNDTFKPPSIVNTGTSTLTIATKRTAPRGTYTVVITGTSGTLVHSTSVTLTIQ